MVSAPQDTIAIIVAGGHGLRMGSNVPKQMLPLGNSPVLCHSLRTFNNYRGIGAIILVLEESIFLQAERYGLNTENYRKVLAVLPGGNTRIESVWRGVQALPKSQLVLIHDGVRPLVRPTLIHRAITAGMKAGAAVPVLDCTETLKQVDHNGQVITTVNRAEFRTVQTPQVFHSDLLVKVYEQCLAQGLDGPDDASLVEQCGFPVATFPGDPDNIKITYPVDLHLAEVLLSSSK